MSFSLGSSVLTYNSLFSRSRVHFSIFGIRLSIDGVGFWDVGLLDIVRSERDDDWIERVEFCVFGGLFSIDIGFWDVGVLGFVRSEKDDDWLEEDSIDDWPDDLDEDWLICSINLTEATPDGLICSTFEIQ